MRHKVAGRGLGRNTNEKKALLRGLVASLFTNLKIETTVAKAKEARRLAERVITLGRKGDLHSRRLALSYLPNKKLISKLFGDIAPNLTHRNSGYLRIVKTRMRRGDNASMAILEFADYDVLAATGEEKKEGRKAGKEKKEQD